MPEEAEIGIDSEYPIRNNLVNWKKSDWKITNLLFSKYSGYFLLIKLILSDKVLTIIVS